jgi:FtsP/CotA-like multicopper oxidase with cupredoxin domain
LAQGQRADLLLTLPASGGAFPILAQREGDRQRTGVILASPDAPIRKLADLADTAVGPIDLSLERAIAAPSGLPGRTTNVRHRMMLTGSMQPYVWTIDDRSWGKHRTLKVRTGQRVEVEMVNRSQMAHPMHLHGHHFQVVAIDGRRVAGANRDTVLVPINGSVTIAFDADNPGRWLFHCHNLFHMAAGMMTELAYDATA